MSDINEDGDSDLDALLGLLGESDAESENESLQPDSQNTVPNVTKSKESTSHNFDIAINNSNQREFNGDLKKNVSNNNLLLNNDNKQDFSHVEDPLEKELILMEQRMEKLKKEISKKKNLKSSDDGKDISFTKLSSVINPNCSKPEASSRYLSEDEKNKFFQELNSKKSEIHSGDTDSEDDEDNRTPLEAQFTSYGREMKQRIAHSEEENSQRHSDNTIKNMSGWKEAKGGSLLPMGKKTSGVVDKVLDSSCDPFSGIKIVKPLISTCTMKELMAERRMIQASALVSQLREGEIDGDWVTIAVIVSKSETKTSQKGSQYSIWQMSDLRDCTKVVSLFLFAGAYKKLWKTTVGTVVGVLNPQIMKESNKTDGRNVLTMSVNTHEKVLVMGTSKDLGWCKGRNKQGSNCRQFVNKGVCEFCIFHIQREYSKMSSKRAEIQSSFGRVDPRKAFQKRVLGKEQVFYGGQLYGTGSVKDLPTKKLVSATKAKDLSTLSSLNTKLKSEKLKEKDRRDSLLLQNLSENHVSTLKSVMNITKESEELGEMLLAPTPGARNLLLHKTKGTSEKEAPNSTQPQPQTLSVKEFLKTNTPKRETIPKAPVMKTPQLGRGLTPNKDLVFEFSPTSKLDPAKAKAASIMKQKGGLHAAERNSKRNKDKSASSEFKTNVKKRLRDATTEQQEEDVELPTEEISAQSVLTKKSLLGSVDINSEKYLRMMRAKSNHTSLIQQAESEEVEKYYSTLEKKEMLEDKMATIMEVPTAAVVCLKCKYTAISASDRCKEQQHPLKRIKALKRFFECRNCKQRAMSLDKLPGKPCSNCSKSTWRRVAMGKEQKGPKLDSEVLSLRGDELDNYSSVSNKIYLNL